MKRAAKAASPRGLTLAATDHRTRITSPAPSGQSPPPETGVSNNVEHFRSLRPFSDGSGIMRDAQTARPQTLRTGDGWFAYNLAANLAQVRG